MPDRRMRQRALLLTACVAGLAAASTAGATPAYNVRAALAGQQLTVGFDFPVARTCRTYLRWDLRDRVLLEPASSAPPVHVWAATFTSPIYMHDRCASPRRLGGQPFAVVTRPRKGWVRVRGAGSRLSVLWTPWAQVCVHGIRTTRTGASHGVRCVATAAAVPR